MPTKILVVDDDDLILRLINITFTKNGYDVYEARNGKEALELADSVEPHIILLDVMMPIINGLDVCRILKENVFTRHIPVILVTAQDEIKDKIAGLHTGADDYITKPFAPAELVARVQTLLNRTKEYLDANPSTKLPGNSSIEREIVQRIKSNEKFAFCYVDIDNFKAFNDKYGFPAGDKIIIETGQIISESVKEFGNPDDFIGHIGGDDFVFITSTNKFHLICSQIIKSFDEKVIKHYSEEDIKNGYIIGKNRQGITVEFPIMTISIVVITNENRKINHPAELGAIEAELKEYVKKLDGSNYIVNRIDNSEKRKKILIAGSSRDCRKHLKNLLEKEQFAITLARNGAEAMLLLPDEKPDLILAYSEMPIIDGYTMCNLIKSNNEFSSIPIVLFSNSDNESSGKNCLDSKADYCYQKPTCDDLIEIIKKYTT